MFRILLKKYLHESILLWVSCALVLFFFPWIRIWTVSQFELSGFSSILEQFRSFEKFSPVPLEQFLTYHGIIGFTFDEPVLLLCVLVWSISRGSDVVSGELNRGTMEMLLAQPISRSRMLMAHGVITIIGLAILCILIYAGIWIGIHTNSTPVTTSGTVRLLQWDIGLPLLPKKSELIPLASLVNPALYVVPTLNLFALGFMMLGISVLFSSYDQYRWRTIGLVIGVYVLQLLLFILSKSTPKTHFLTPFSFLAAYQPDWIVQRVNRAPGSAWSFWNSRMSSEKGDGLEGLFESLEPLSYVAVLLVLGILAYILAWLRFRKRDLPAPQ